MLKINSQKPLPPPDSTPTVSNGDGHPAYYGSVHLGREGSVLSALACLQVQKSWFKEPSMFSLISSKYRILFSSQLVCSLSAVGWIPNLHSSPLPPRFRIPNNALSRERPRSSSSLALLQSPRDATHPMACGDHIRTSCWMASVRVPDCSAFRARQTEPFATESFLKIVICMAFTPRRLCSQHHACRISNQSS